MQNRTDHSEETDISDCDKEKYKIGRMAENPPTYVPVLRYNIDVIR